MLLIRIRISLFIVIIALLTAINASAECRSTFFNPITDVCWHCVFPIRFGGINIIGSGIDSPTDDTGSNPICVCNTNIGIKASFWEPARIAETVKDPYCFNLMGLSLSNPIDGFLGGSYREDAVAKNGFAQAHWYSLNIWSLLNLFLDIPCLEPGGFDVGYLTEVDPMWSDDLLAFIINPEALLFGNPLAQLSCMADSVASNIGIPLKYLFWCMGSWGSAYPLTGHINNDNYVQDNAAIAARMIYKLSRELALWDTGSNECGAIMMPIWIKDNYRMHIMKPTRDWTCHPIGRSSLIWGSMKNPPGGTSTDAPDNFDWMVFRKQLCCVGWNVADF